MKLKYTILYVESVPISLAFYEKAFGFKTKFLHEAEDYGELDTGDTTLAFASRKLMMDQGKNPAPAIASQPVFEIALETTDVKKWLDQSIDQGATLVQDLVEQPWGQTVAYVSDKDGYLVEICSPVGK